MWKRRGSITPVVATSTTSTSTTTTDTSPAAASASPDAPKSLFTSIGSPDSSSSSSLASPTSVSSPHTYAARSAVIGSIGDDELGTRLQNYMEVFIDT